MTDRFPKKYSVLYTAQLIVVQSGFIVPVNKVLVICKFYSLQVEILGKADKAESVLMWKEDELEFFWSSISKMPFHVPVYFIIPR